MDLENDLPQTNNVRDDNHHNDHPFETAYTKSMAVLEKFSPPPPPPPNNNQDTATTVRRRKTFGASSSVLEQPATTTTSHDMPPSPPLPTFSPAKFSSVVNDTDTDPLLLELQDHALQTHHDDDDDLSVEAPGVLQDVDLMDLDDSVAAPRELDLLESDPDDLMMLNDNDDDAKVQISKERDDDDEEASRTTDPAEEASDEASSAEGGRGRTKRKPPSSPVPKNVSLAESKEHDDEDDNDDETNETTKTSPARGKGKESPSSDTFDGKAEKESDKEKDSDDEEESTTNTMDDILSSTEQLFLQADDKLSVKVKEIIMSLQAEFTEFTFDKSVRGKVREKLAELITNFVNEKEQESSEEEVEDEESGEEEVEASDYEDEGANADDEEEYEETSAKKKRKKKSSQNKTPKNKRKSSSPRSSGRRRNSSAKAKKSAMRIHAEKLRKRRMAELRVRNEELQLVQNKQDQERAEQIAAKFETNTDDMRVQRLEKRLHLLKKLDEKRITVVASSEVRKEKLPDEKETKITGAGATDAKREELRESESDSSSEEEMELVVVGENKNQNKLTSWPKNSAALSLLDRVDRMSRFAGKAPNGRPVKKPSASPGRSVRARAALKNGLLSKKRKMGNMWLARELGYKTEEEHLRDCYEVEERKRQLIIKREEERIRKNEAFRERMLEVGEELNEEEEAIDENEANSDERGDVGGDEEDEEMALAKSLEAAGEGADSSSAADATIEDHEAVKNDDDDSDDGDANPFDDDEPSKSADPSDSQSDEKTPILHDSTEESKSTVAEADVTKMDVEEAVSSGAEPSSTVVTPTVDSKASSAIETDKEKPRAEEEVGEDDDDDNGEKEFDGEEKPEEDSKDKKPSGPRNAAWKAMLLKEAEKVKKMKRKKKHGLIDEEADEEEEEEVAGLEDFGFVVNKRKNGDDEDEDKFDEINEDDLENVVDDLSDNEGDEEAGMEARKALEQKEERERHKEVMRRMRDGYDGRRGGIASGGGRGMHRFDQLVAADNREDAKRLGLLNDDEIDSDQENGGGDGNDEEEDEAVLLDKMLKDRFLHRSSVELEEHFSDDEDDEDENENPDDENAALNPEEEEDRQQERLAKRFAKRARMQRLMEAYGHEEEFSRSNLIDDDATLKMEIQKMKVRRTAPGKISYEVHHFCLQRSISCIFFRMVWLASEVSHCRRTVVPRQVALLLTGRSKRDKKPLPCRHLPLWLEVSCKAAVLPWPSRPVVVDPTKRERVS